MNKSLQYMIELSKDESRTNIPRSGWEDAEVLNTMVIVNSMLSPDSKKLKDKIESTIEIDEFGKTVDVTWEFNSNNANYNYFTSKFITHDGTMLFTYDTIAMLISNIFTLQTCNTNILTDEIRAELENYKLTYIVGDIILHNDFGMKNINGKEMFGQDTWVCIPIEFKVEKRGE